MTFEVAPDRDHLDIQNDGMRYEGQRYRATCRLAGKVYGQPFGVDVAFGDPVFGEPERVVAEDLLAFAGIPPPVLRGGSLSDRQLDHFQAARITLWRKHVPTSAIGLSKSSAKDEEPTAQRPRTRR